MHEYLMHKYLMNEYLMHKYLMHEYSTSCNVVGSIKNGEEFTEGRVP